MNSVKGMLFDLLINVYRQLQSFFIAMAPTILCQSIYRKSQSINLFFGIYRTSQIIYCPINTSMFGIYKVVFDVFISSGTHRTILFPPIHTIRRRKCPQYTGVKDSSLICRSTFYLLMINPANETSVLQVQCFPTPKVKDFPQLAIKLFT